MKTGAGVISAGEGPGERLGFGLDLVAVGEESKEHSV